ncbi:MAG: RHS repeat domain-containing protein [Candidatus Thiodiazotropha endolucinida]
MYKATRYATDNTPYTYARYYYDALGNLTYRYNWRGYKTTYSHDGDGRQTSRTEASGTSSAKTVTTSWDAQLNKPLVVTEPNRITEYTYDSEGRLLSKTQRPSP